MKVQIRPPLNAERLAADLSRLDAEFAAVFRRGVDFFRGMYVGDDGKIYSRPPRRTGRLR